MADLEAFTKSMESKVTHDHPELGEWQDDLERHYVRMLYGVVAIGVGSIISNIVLLVHMRGWW